MKSPYIFFPIILLWLFIIAVDLFVMFDGFERVRAKVSSRVRTSKSDKRKRED